MSLGIPGGPTREVGSPNTVLVVGSGGREHALAWRLRQDGVRRVLVAPGNAGMAGDAELHPGVPAGDAEALLDLCRAQEVELVVIGPEGPLVDGLADRLRAAGLAVFGPDAAAARIEGSKAFCREVAEAAGVPMAGGAVFEAVEPAMAFARTLGGRAVVKADGLAAGKGVTVCDGLDEVGEGLRDALVDGVFGAAGARVVVERALEGREASLIAITDGNTTLALPLARDHKRLADGDMGPNTGGMGAYSPLPDLRDEEAAALVERFHGPVLRELARRGTPFRGALYAGLMLTDDGPRLLEFNARFGDPETQAIIPRLGVPLAPLLLSAATGRLAEAADRLGLPGVVRSCAEASACVVLAAAGYPGSPRTGAAIEGIEAARAEAALVFTAGVEAGAGGLQTAGGRVLAVVGRGSGLEEAAQAAYRGADRIEFSGRQLRRDIGRVPDVDAARSPALAGVGA
jgi:phosphoribosylamine--glycine ligase